LPTPPSDHRRAVLEFKQSPDGKAILTPLPPRSTQPFATDYSFVFERAVAAP
jgi:hypothetical protein